MIPRIWVILWIFSNILSNKSQSIINNARVNFVYIFMGHLSEHHALNSNYFALHAIKYGSRTIAIVYSPVANYLLRTPLVQRTGVWTRHIAVYKLWPWQPISVGRPKGSPSANHTELTSDAYSTHCMHTLCTWFVNMLNKVAANYILHIDEHDALSHHTPLFEAGSIHHKKKLKQKAQVEENHRRRRLDCFDCINKLHQRMVMIYTDVTQTGVRISL